MKPLKHLLHHVRRRIHKVPEASYLPIALGIAVGFAFLLTVLSVSIYMWNGSSNLDLSRPGYERQRAQVLTNEPQVTTYDTTGTITQAAIDSFLKEYDARTHALSQYGDFRDQALSDAVLQINDN